MHIDLVQGLQIVIPQVLETLNQLHGVQLLSCGGVVQIGTYFRGLKRKSQPGKRR